MQSLGREVDEAKNENKVDAIITRCIARARPQTEDQKGYTKGINENGEFIYLENYDFISAFRIEEELKHEIANYLHTKEVEVNSRIIQAKCEAYELALTHTRPAENNKEEE